MYFGWASGGKQLQIRVYYLGQQDLKEKNYAKRSCREAKKKRRFLVSHKEGDFVYLVLEYPEGGVNGEVKWFDNTNVGMLCFFPSGWSIADLFHRWQATQW